jgi:(2Fe-2S) ferredoxin
MLQKLEGRFLQWQKSKSGKPKGILIQTSTVVQSVSVGKNLRVLLSDLLTPNMSISLQAKVKKKRLVAKFLVLIPSDGCTVSQLMLQPTSNQSIAKSAAIEVKVCNSKQCCKNGGVEICRVLEKLQLEPNIDIKIKKVGCFGDCQRAPVIKIDGQKYQRLTPSAVGSLVKKLWHKVILRTA